MRTPSNHSLHRTADRKYALLRRLCIYFSTLYVILTHGTAADSVPFEDIKVFPSDDGEYRFDTSERKVVVVCSHPWTRLSVDGENVWSLPTPFIVHSVAVSKSQKLIAVLVYSQGPESLSDNRRVAGLQYEFIQLLRKTDLGWHHVVPLLMGDRHDPAKPWVNRLLSTSGDEQYIFLRMGKRVGGNPNGKIQYDEQCWDIERQEFISEPE